MEFKNKVIFILSYEEWGSMLMSKHHYAIELSKLGNEVYFIGHFDKRYRLKRGQIKIKSTEFDHLYVVEHRALHPYFLKFKMLPIYNFFTRFHVKAITRKIGKSPDVIWSFDTGNSLPFNFFSKKSLKIYMPVDGPYHTTYEYEAAKSAQFIFSVANGILDFYKNINVPRHRVDHGVSDYFLAKQKPSAINNPLRIGYSGSLLRNDIDTITFLQIIYNNQDKIFEFWGEFEAEKSSIHLPQDISKPTLDFINELKKSKNVILHGATGPEKLAEGLKKVDALLVCYNIPNLQNSHKVLEYLAAGKVIISSYISHYENQPGLVQMVADPLSNKSFLQLFYKVTSDLQNLNSCESQSARIKYAAGFTYKEQVKRIESFIG